MLSERRTKNEESMAFARTYDKSSNRFANNNLYFSPYFFKCYECKPIA